MPLAGAYEKSGSGILNVQFVLSLKIGPSFTFQYDMDVHIQ